MLGERLTHHMTDYQAAHECKGFMIRAWELGERFMSKLLLNSALCSVIVIGSLRIGHAQQDQGSQLSPQEQARKNIQLMRLSRQPDGLHKAALANGGTYVVYGSEEKWIAAVSVANLVRECKIAAVVKITSQEIRLTGDGRGIGTFYKFDLESVLKGALERPHLYSIVRPGGTYVFSDNSIASAVSLNSPRLHIGGTYLVFVSPSSDSPENLWPTFDSQGIFELLGDGVTVHNYSMTQGDHLREKYDQESQAQLLGDTREAISEE